VWKVLSEKGYAPRMQPIEMPIELENRPAGAGGGGGNRARARARARAVRHLQKTRRMPIDEFKNGCVSSSSRTECFRFPCVPRHKNNNTGAHTHSKCLLSFTQFNTGVNTAVDRLFAASCGDSPIASCAAVIFGAGSPANQHQPWLRLPPNIDYHL
jgi:hypothetical protein